MDRGRYRYRASVLEELARHGVQPTASTPPALVRAYVSDLYRFEIRRLRAQLLRGDIPKRAYSGEVVRLRRRYPVLSLPLVAWTDDGESGDKGEKGEKGERGQKG